MPTKIKRKTAMHYITIPEPAPLDHVPGDEVLTFRDLICKVIAGDPRITQDDASITKYMTIAAKAKELKAGDVWEVEPATHEFLSLLVRTFQNYHPEAKIALLPLIHAITSAPAKKPAGSEATASPAES